MKKVFPTLVLVSLLAVLFVPIVTSAQANYCILKHNITNIDIVCVKGVPVNEIITRAWGLCCMVDAIYTATDWIFVIIMVVVGLLILWGALEIVTAAGAPEKVAAGRSKILYALIGLVVALLARAIPAVVEALLGM